MHWPIKPRSHQLCDSAGIVAIGLVDLSLENGTHVPRFNTDDRYVRFGESTEQPLRQRSRFQSNPLHVIRWRPEPLQESLRRARYLHFAGDPAGLVNNTDARFLDRYIQSTKMLHAALLLLMPEARIRGDLGHLLSPSA